VKERIKKLIADARAIAWATPVDHPSAVARLLAVAYRRQRAQAPLEPWEPVPEPLERARALLDQFEAELRALDEDVPPALALFRTGPDRDRYAHAIAVLVDESIRRGRAELAEELAALDGFPKACACTCREHRIPGCAVCLRVERCEVHASEDPARLSPRWRREHADRAARGLEPPADDGEPRIVHVLRFGRVLCGFSRGTPSTWPFGHRWVALEDAGLATCPGCLAGAGVDASQGHGELRELSFSTRAANDLRARSES
jgi:hypothetical protein